MSASFAFPDLILCVYSSIHSLAKKKVSRRTGQVGQIVCP